MKKITVYIPVFLLLFTIMFTGCNQRKKQDIEKFNIVCTIFPQYDWVRQIIGDKKDNFNLTLLLNNRIDLHNYQPSVDDIIKISNCDLFIYIGGESDEWVDDVLEQALNPNMIVINLLDILGDKAKHEDHHVESMHEDDDHDHHNDDAHGHDDHDGDDHLDEHVWLSLRNAIIFCPVIVNALSSLDEVNTETYQNNMGSYIGKLATLDFEYQTAIRTSPLNTLLFADRFPFRYLVDDYSISYYAAFSGCSAETEASFETIIFLAKKMDELNLNSVMVTESSEQSIAKTVISNTKKRNQKILVLDAMQSVTSRDVDNGTTYISIMEKNLSVLKEALK